MPSRPSRKGHGNYKLVNEIQPIIAGVTKFARAKPIATEEILYGWTTWTTEPRGPPSAGSKSPSVAKSLRALRGRSQRTLRFKVFPSSQLPLVAPASPKIALIDSVHNMPGIKLTHANPTQVRQIHLSVGVAFSQSWEAFEMSCAAKCRFASPQSKINNQNLPPHSLLPRSAVAFPFASNPITTQSGRPNRQAHSSRFAGSASIK